MSRLKQILAGGPPLANSANPANPGKAEAPDSRDSQDSQGGIPKVKNAEPTDPAALDLVRRAIEAREALRARAWAELDANPALEQSWIVDDSSDAEFVVLAVAIRGTGAAELSIERDRFDSIQFVTVTGKPKCH